MSVVVSIGKRRAVSGEHPEVFHRSPRNRGRARVDNAMVKALARGFRWRKLLDTGVYGSIEEMAAAEKINSSYVGRLLRMTLLAPEIVEAVLDGRQPTEMTLAVLMEPFAVVRREQRLRFASARSGEST